MFGTPRLLFALGSIAIAYFAYEPLPEGITQQYIIYPFFAMWRVMRYVAVAASDFGYDGPALFRTMINFGARVTPVAHFDIDIKDMDFNGVPVRIYTPQEKESAENALRTILYLHGGGFVLGGIDTFDDLMKMISLDLKAMVVFVDYRLAPEHVFPAAINDVFVAAKYLLKNATKLNADPKRIALMGDSAGGSLAASVAQRIKQQNDIKTKPKLKVLIFPMLQATDFDTPSMRYNADKSMLSRDLLVWFYNYYIFGDQRNFNKMRENNHTHPHVKQNMPLKYMMPEHLPRNDEILRDYKMKPPFYGDIEFWQKHKQTFLSSDLAPAMTRTSDIAGLPQTYIVSCQRDILRDESFHYAARLRKEDVKVDHVNLVDCFHGWWAGFLIRNVDTFQRHYREVIKYVDEHL